LVRRQHEKPGYFREDARARAKHQAHWRRVICHIFTTAGSGTIVYMAAGGSLNVF
jgi:hypothetical protein